MQTEKIKVSNNGTGMDEARELTQKTADLIGLKGKDNFHFCLLSEEMLSMISAMVGDFEAYFWIKEENKKCEFHLDAESKVDYAKKRELISVATNKKNAFSMGIMEKIREMTEGFLYDVEESFKFQSEYGTGILDYGTLGMTGSEISSAVYSWSMQKYKESLKNNENENDETVSEAWDELEKSIIANIADDVQVGIKNNMISIVILKKF